METIVNESPVSRQPVPPRKVQRPTVSLTVIARSLAAVIYTAEAEYLGDQRALFSELSADRQAAYERRARVEILRGIGWVESKARARAIRQAVTDNNICDEFNEDARRLIEQTIGDAFQNYEPALETLASREDR